MTKTVKNINIFLNVKIKSIKLYLSIHENIYLKYEGKNFLFCRYITYIYIIFTMLEI